MPPERTVTFLPVISAGFTCLRWTRQRTVDFFVFFFFGGGVEVFFLGPSRFPNGRNNLIRSERSGKSLEELKNLLEPWQLGGNETRTRFLVPVETFVRFHHLTIIHHISLPFLSPSRSFLFPFLFSRPFSKFSSYCPQNIWNHKRILSGHVVTPQREPKRIDWTSSDGSTLPIYVPTYIYIDQEDQRMEIKIEQ